MNEKNPKLQAIVIICVALVWVANFVAKATITDYEPSPQVDAIFLSVLGFLLATRNKNDDTNSKENEEEKKP